ncbi:YobI family P-loop NTPase [Butyrivibrio sp. AD3002]|uniref:YobI family P-loop NTPase n=1 Tax=Butyrivibrio sp. AD3002 TaxID=1280670 RepID=UPI002FE6A541
MNGSVKFVYAIKDDMFKKPGECTKFFDFIIPIVPYISSVNSGEILREKMKVSSYDISDEYISLVSPYISDARLEEK